MNSRCLRIPAVLAFAGLLLASSGVAQTAPSTAESPYGGTVVEDIVARVNDQIISQSDYDRAMAELDQEGREHGATMQQMSAEHKDLLRNLIDQQLWLSKGKELGITGDTELVKRLDDIRKQYNMASIDDLEQAAKEQGISFEDFKANIRNSLITQEVMRQEVGERIQVTPGEAMAYYNEHKQDYVQPESVRLSEILISTGTPAAPDAITGAPSADDPAKVDAAKAKADDIEARLHAGGDFAQLARSFSDGPTASEGGELGQFRRGALAKVLEDATFALQSGQYTAPIRTRQGFVILKVEQHIQGGVQPYKDAQDQVEEALYMSRMEPAIRAYLTTLREDSYIDIKPGFADSGASPNETKPVFSAYVPPAPKKKAKVERTRYRESTRTFRQKSPQSEGPATGPAETAPAETAPAEAAAASSPAATTATAPATATAATTAATPATATAAAAPETAAAAAPATAAAPANATTAAAATPAKTKKALFFFKKKSNTEQASEKPGKKEKIRFGQAPRETLPTATTNTATVNAGALPETASNEQLPANPLEAAPVQAKTRFSERARTTKKAKKTPAAPKVDALAPPPPDAGEVADRQTQSAPLGLAGDTSTTKKKKKKTATTTTEKTRMSQEPKKPAAQAPVPTIPAPVEGAPAPATAPAAAPQQ